MKRELQLLEIGQIKLLWSPWYTWKDIDIDSRKKGTLKVPNRKSGVYEVRLVGKSKRLTIGKTNDLRYRVKQGLVRGKAPHSSGEKIRAFEDTSQIEIRWGQTNRPAAAEEELHRLYCKLYGELPKYTEKT